MYSPKIREDLVRRLYRLKQSDARKKPMTFYVNEAVEQYLIINEDKTNPENHPSITNSQNKSHLSN